ncbi:hypothetical protein GOV05_02355 [Candidatus Woesearchaeota archaeon]|nr:hypothetical protein [Candidatus Woesearchaeota archaeon]
MVLEKEQQGLEVTQKSNASYKRQTAYKALIKDLLGGEYVKEEGWNPNYVKTSLGNISRVNVIGFVIEKNEEESVVIDDSTSNINLRNFENKQILNKPQIGDLVLVVGKIREYNNSRYLLADIIRKLESPDWLKVRLKELENKKTLVESKPSQEEQTKTNTEEPLVERVEEEGGFSKNNYESVLELIKSLDDGPGVSIDKVIKESNVDDCQKIINTLLEEGEIFEIRSGMVKLL